MAPTTNLIMGALNVLLLIWRTFSRYFYHRQRISIEKFDYFTCVSEIVRFKNKMSDKDTEFPIDQTEAYCDGVQDDDDVGLTHELRLHMNKLVAILSQTQDSGDSDDSLLEDEDSDQPEDEDSHCGNTEQQWAYPEDYYDQYDEIPKRGDYDHSEEAS